MATQRKLGRRTDHRSSLLRNQVRSLFDHGRITTTLTRAKETRREAEKLITTAKKGDLAAKRRVSAYLFDDDKASRKLMEEIVPTFEGRQGGYTRILKLGPRRGDASEMAILELVGYEPKKPESKEEKKKQAGKLNAE